MPNRHSVFSRYRFVIARYGDSRRQSGVAMFVTMVIVLVLMVMGIAASRMGMMQSSISYNSKISALAFQAGQSGIDAVVAETSVGVNDPGNLINKVVSLGTEVRRCVTVGNVKKDGDCGADDFFDARRTLKVSSVSVYKSTTPRLNNGASAGCDAVVETTVKACLVQANALFGSGACNEDYKSEQVQRFSKYMPLCSGGENPE